MHFSRSQSKPHHKKNTRVKIEDLHMDYYSYDDHSCDSGEKDRSFKLNEPSPSSDSHELGGLTTQESVTVVCITDCPTITAYAGKCYSITGHMACFISDHESTKGKHPYINIGNGIHNIKGKTSVNILVSNYNKNMSHLIRGICRTLGTNHREH